MEIKLSKASEHSLGYSAARAGDGLTEIATELYGRHGTALPEETIAQLKSGMQSRKHELVGTRVYVREGNNLTLWTDKKLPEQSIELTVNYACGLSPHEFGKFKTLDAALYDKIAAIRTETSRYVSNRYKALEKAYNAIIGNGGNARAANKAFMEWLAKGERSVVQSILSRQANAIKNSDPTVPATKEDLIKALVDAIRKA
jgi:hypothetical protein